MNAVYISGHNTSDNLPELLGESLSDVMEVVNVTDAIGLLRTGNYDCVFVNEKTVDVPIDRAYKMLGKFVRQDCVIVVANVVKPADFSGVWIELPKNKTELLELFQRDLPEMGNEFDGKKMDLKQLRELAKGDEEFVLNILETFVEECPFFISGLTKYLKSKNIESIGALAHKVKSPIKMLGINELDNSMEYLDDLGIENPAMVDWTAVTRKTQSLILCLTQLLEEVKNEVQVVGK